MKYRSYNSELIIATSLIVNIFNDIIIDRRKHNVNRDYSKPISFDEIVQQEIEIPCILGDRSVILKSLENEPGRYKLPLIILQNKSLKTDPNRMCDLHSDVFYQQDSSFSKLDQQHHLYKHYDLSKRRAQPVIIDYDLTIITKYKEDLDQIISNWVVHFRPDVYFKWWHPKNKTEPLTSQLIWSHNLSFDLPIEYNPQNVFTYKSTSSFSLKSWMFPGMNLKSNDDMLEDKGIIKSFKFFTNRSDKLQYDENPDKVSTDVRDEDDFYVFGNLENTQAGSLQFWGVTSDQKFIYEGNDIKGLKEGDYAVTNIFNEKNNIISGDTLVSKIKTQTDVGDFFSSTDQTLINKWSKYQMSLTNDSSIYPDNKSLIKVVYFKGGFDENDLYAVKPSGDFLFNYFYKTYNDNKKAKLSFGDSMINNSKVNVSYDIESKTLTIDSKNETRDYSYEMKNIINSKTGVIQEFHLKSGISINKENPIELLINKVYDKDYKEDYKLSKIDTKNINLINGQFNLRGANFLISDSNELSERTKILNALTSFWKSVNLVELSSNKYKIEIEDSKYGDYIKAKNLLNVDYKKLNVVLNKFQDNYYYQVLMNNYIYIVIKINSQDESEVDIYDIGKFMPLAFMNNSAPIFEITLPESKMLLGLNIFMKY